MKIKMFFVCMIFIGSGQSTYTMNLASAISYPVSKLCTPSGYAFLAAGGCLVSGKVCDWVSDRGVIVFNYMRHIMILNHAAIPASDLDKNNQQRDERDEATVMKYVVLGSLGLKGVSYAAYGLTLASAAGGLLLMCKK